MDLFEKQRFIQYLALGIAEDEIDWTAHDNRYHPSSLVWQYLAAHGLLSKYLPQSPAQDSVPFNSTAFQNYLAQGTIPAQKEQV